MKTSALIDKFGREHTYLRISLTDACNLRCKYCMPDEKVLVTPSKHLMQADEILAISKIFVDMGINKIRLTGGEPLVRKDAKTILTKLASLPVSLSISTNGVLVDDFIPELKAAGIQTVNVSLDTLHPDEFQKITQRGHFERIMANIQLLQEEGFRLKINMVPLKNMNENSLLDFIHWTKHQEVEVRFIEFMPFQGNAWDLSQVFTYREMLALIEEQVSFHKLPDAPHDTAKHYQVEGYAGSFAFITTITEPFCDSCNRLRLTADGKMKNCLFSTGEMDLLTPFREGKDIRELILTNVASKKRERGGVFEENMLSQHTNRSMIRIGG